MKNTLTIFSLEESALIRQTIAAWNTLHPEVRVEYTVGLTSTEGTAATREDVVRQLNTRLLAGDGPDLLILDGLSADFMIRQGLLTDLTSAGQCTGQLCHGRWALCHSRRHAGLHHRRKAFHGG